MIIKTDVSPVRLAVKEAYRLARTGDAKVTSAVGNYLKLGEDIPMATMMYKTDEMIEARQHFHNMRSRNIINDDQFDQSWDKMAQTISTQEAVDENFDSLIKFDESLTKLYPKSIKKRMKIYSKRIKEALKKLDIENITGKKQ